MKEFKRYFLSTAAFSALAFIPASSAYDNNATFLSFEFNQLNLSHPAVLEPARLVLETPYQTHLKWDEFDLPISLNIPKINFFDYIQLADIRQSDNDPKISTYQTPNEGIATPRHPLKYAIFVFGHSRWQGQLQPFREIQNLNKGDIILVQNQDQLLFFFMVKDFKLINLDEPEAVLNGYGQPTLVLQTTAKSKKWILDQDLILSKVKDNLPKEPDGVDLVVQIEAVQVEIRGLPWVR